MNRLKKLTGVCLAAAMTLALPTMAHAAPNSLVESTKVDLQKAVSQMPALAPEVLTSNGTIRAFVQLNKKAELENNAQTQSASAQQTKQEGHEVLDELKDLDPSAKLLFDTQYSIAGIAVSADAQALRDLVKKSDSVLRISVLPVHHLAVENDAEEAPAQQDAKDAKAAKGAEQSDKAAEGKQSDKAADAKDAQGTQDAQADKVQAPSASKPASEEKAQSPADKAESKSAKSEDDSKKDADASNQAADSKDETSEASRTTFSTSGKDARKYPRKLIKDGDRPYNKNSDALMSAVKAWSQTGATGRGVNVAIMDTGVDYTHKDFGGSGSTSDYETALSMQGPDDDPLKNPTLRAMLDTNKYKGGYDFAGTHYGEDGNMTAVPDPNPIDGHGGHHGTHVAGSSLGYGVLANGNTYRGDYSELTNESIADWEVGPGTAPLAGLYALKVFGDNGGKTDVVLNAIEWIARHNATASAADKIDIVSMSLGGDFGSPDDPENIAVNNLTRSGVLAVIAAGNSGDISDIVGAPGTADTALTVAASQSGRTLQDAIEIKEGPASLKGQHLAGQYSQNYEHLADFTLSAPVARVTSPDNLEGCESYSPEDQAAVRGKIAYIQWDDHNVTCGSAQRFTKAQEAGAVGILFASQSNIPQAGIAGNAGIPGFQLVSDAAGLQDLQQAIDGGTLEVTLASSLRMSLNADYSRQLADTVASFTSRGVHGSYDGTVKPDVAAPGVGILSASAGTGDKAEAMSGTSMATPLTSGVTALVKQKHPDWTPAQIKAQIINTADHDVYNDGRTVALGPIRVGTGRVDAYAAVNNEVLVTSDNTDAVTAQFGVIQVKQSGYSATKTFTVTNMGDTARSYTVSYEPRTNTPGVTYTLSTTSVTVPAHGTANFNVTLSIPDPSALRHTMDPSMEVQVGGVDRNWVTDASGIVKLTPANVPAPASLEPGMRVRSDADTTAQGFGLRVAVTSAPKPVSETNVFLGEDRDSLSIAGHGLNQGSGRDAYVSKVYPLVLSGVDPDDGYQGEPGQAANRSLNAGDIREFGYSSTAPQLANPSEGLLNIGFVTQNYWNHVGSQNMMPMVVLQTFKYDGTGTPQADSLFRMSLKTREDQTQLDTVSVETEKLNPLTRSFDSVDVEPLDPAFVFDSNKIVMPVKLSALGFTDDDSHAVIQYQIVTQSSYAKLAPNQFYVDTAGENQSTDRVILDAYSPELWFGEVGAEGNGVAAFDDQDSASIALHRGPSVGYAGSPSVLAIHNRGFSPNGDATETDEDREADVTATVDKSELRLLLAQAQQLHQEQYTPETWDTFQKFLQTAQEVEQNENATQQQVDVAVLLLQHGMGQLKERANKDALGDEIAQVHELNEQDYTPSTWAAYQAELKKAQDLFDDDNASQEDVDAATDALAQARQDLVKRANTQEAQKSVDEAEALQAKDYTENSWKALSAALARLKGVIADPEATQKQVDDARAEMLSAMSLLVKLGDKATLKADVDADAQLSREDYTEDSWQAYTEALVKAQAVLDDDQASQAQVDLARAELRAARAELKKRMADAETQTDPVETADTATQTDMVDTKDEGTQTDETADPKPAPAEKKDADKAADKKEDQPTADKAAESKAESPAHAQARKKVMVKRRHAESRELAKTGSTLLAVQMLMLVAAAGAGVIITLRKRA